MRAGGVRCIHITQNHSTQYIRSYSIGNDHINAFGGKTPGYTVLGPHTTAAEAALARHNNAGQVITGHHTPYQRRRRLCRVTGEYSVNVG